MKDPSITWRRTFPDSAPGTDGVAIFEGRVIGRVRLLAEGPRDPKPWQHERRNALASAGHGSLDRALAGTAPAQPRLEVFGARGDRVACPMEEAQSLSELIEAKGSSGQRGPYRGASAPGP